MDILGYGILFAVLAGALRVFIEMLLYKKYYKRKLQVEIEHFSNQ